MSGSLGLFIARYESIARPLSRIGISRGFNPLTAVNCGFRYAVLQAAVPVVRVVVAGEWGNYAPHEGLTSQAPH
jgi:hypothetical protein